MSTADVLFRLNPRVHLTSFFAGEHGLRGNLPPGQSFDSYIDPTTGLPVFSIYNAANGTYAPQPWMLQNVTALVYDMQDIGARCYTVISTLAHCLKSAKLNNKKFIVLDRPNPINGNTVSGPLLDMSCCSSFIGIWKIPLRHGLTVGELALLFNEEMDIHHNNLHIVKMQGFEGRPSANQYQRYGWINPSPNIPHYTSALIYPGIVLFEAARNVSLGRGTTTPFQVLGAPFVDAQNFYQKIQEYQQDPLYRPYFNGVKIIISYFLPTTSYHSGKHCSGISIIILDLNEIQNPIALGLTLFKAMMDLYEDQMMINDNSFALRIGNNKVLPMMREGKSIPDIEKGWNEELIDFTRRRREYLLYH